ncbi:PREDICTED: cytokine receptor common subunit beta-like isoform X3 [Crocodylus porosus]|nr:PREDICTED: cytokine receptor common subunit beta-like isoform X3 [Crocodylus porosus]
MMNFYSIFLLLLPWAFGVRKLQESIPQQSLTCYNDYTSLMTCMWEECSEAQHFLNMTLYYNDDTEDSVVLPCESHQVEGHTDCQGSLTHWVCRKNHTTFGTEQKVIYSLKPDQELQTELRVILFQNVQPLPPQSLFINVTEGGDFLLAWEAAGGINGSTWPDNILEYEVTYKRDWESWGSSSSVLVSNTSKYLFSHNSLVPGSTYVARVRAKPSQESNFTGQYSAWSTEVSWETQAGDDGHPKNLHCLFNGVDRLLCSWEVRQEVTSSVLFTLFYKATQTSEEKECLPIHEKKLPNIPYVLQSCEISITSPNHMCQYNISVRPQKVEMQLELFKHIKVPAPVNLTVTKTKDQEYKLRWVKHALHYEDIRQTYEVLYWKADQPLELAKPNRTSTDEPHLVLRQDSLEPLTCYRAKVRARVHASSGYNGTWSEWSEEHTWKTEHVLAPYIPICIAIFFTIMLVAVGWYSWKYLLSKKKKWEEKIPNPSKSQLVQGFFQKVSLRNQLLSSLPDFNSENHLVKEQADSLQVLDGEKIISATSPGAEASKTKLSYIVLDLKNQHQFSPVSSPASLPSSPFDSISNQSTSQSSSPTLLTSVGTAKADTATQKRMTHFSYNGPYLFFPCGQLQTNAHQGLGASPVRIRENPTFLQYVSLPQKDCFQFPPLQKTGATHLHPFACLDQKEKTHPVAEGQDALQDQPVGEEGVKEKREGQRSPIAVPVISSSQKCPLGYITSEGLCLPPAKESVSLSPSLDPQEQMLTTAGTLTSNSQLPQATDYTSSPALPSGRSGVSLPVPAQASAAPPGSQQPELGSNMTLPLDLPKCISLSPSALLEGVAQENDLVTFNPDGGRPVFLYQVGEYCFFPGLKPSEKTPLSQKASLASKLSEDSGVDGKPVCDGGSTNNNKDDAVCMQAIQLFKAPKTDDYFGQQPAVRARELC